MNLSNLYKGKKMKNNVKKNDVKKKSVEKEYIVIKNLFCL
jgi:hypothetical protein